PPGELGAYWRPLRHRSAQRPGWSWHERGVLSADELRELHRGIDVLAVPSTWPEWLGLVTLEAQGLGTPVILSDLPSQRDLASGDGRSSWFVPPGDAAALARTLVDVWEAKRDGRLEAPQPRCPSPAEYARELLEVYRG
ncbi:MAG: glycosyltransferase, partial [Myxococcales bacterium]|nr:glycosyltransferase [Myxococcales bacterium]